MKLNRKSLVPLIVAIAATAAWFSQDRSGLAPLKGIEKPAAPKQEAGSLSSTRSDASQKTQNTRHASEPEVDGASLDPGRPTHALWEDYQKTRALVLPSEKEKTALRTTLLDRRLLAEAFSALEIRTEEKKSASARDGRIHRISYVNDVLSDSGNPNREEALNGIEKTLNTRLPDLSAVDPELARSWVGDRVELFMMLLHYAPSRAIQLTKDQTDPALRELYRLASAEAAERQEHRTRTRNH